jgi:hypothetical protein
MSVDASVVDFMMNSSGDDDVMAGLPALQGG